MDFRRTPAQQEAIATLDRNVIVLAGAGTGKTYVLVQRFLHLLEHKPEWPTPSLVAITFTRLAARQMRTRIVREVVRKRREQPESALWRRRARELDQLQVSTVHSLCENLLRAHALEVDLDPDFQIADEHDAQLLQRQALDALLRRLDEERPPWLEALQAYTLQDIQQVVQDMFRKRSTLHAMLHSMKTQPDDLLAAWHALIQEEQDRAWEKYWQAHPDLPEAIAWVKRIRHFPIEDKWGQKIEPARCAAQALASRDWEAAVSQVGEGGLGRMSGGQAKNWEGPDALATAKMHVKAINAACKFLQKKEFQTKPNADDVRAAHALQAWLQLWDWSQTHYERLKRAQRCLDFDDLEIKTQTLLNQATSNPQSRIGRYVNGLRHVLADEHQDINPVQQQIINALAPVDEPGRLFVVGDTKQSIYRFRQAQVTAFAGLATDLRALTGIPETELTDSFRTHAQLTAATNYLFQRVFQPLHGSDPEPYEAKPLALKSSRPSPPSGTPVELHLVCRPEDEQLSDDRNARQDEARVVAARLLQLAHDATPVRDLKTRETRPFRMSDAAVLLRSLSDLHLYESEFRQANVPYRVISGTPLQSQPHIRSLAALLKHLHNPQDDFSLAIALRSPLFGLSDETLYRLCARTQEANMPLRRFACVADREMDQAELVRDAGQILANLYALARVALPDRLLRQALEDTGYLASCLADADDYRRDRHLDDVYAFQAYVRQNATRGLGALLRTFETIGADYMREEEESASGAHALVQIMSVHAAKGLEFPVVFVPQLDRRLMSGNQRQAALVDFDPEYGIVSQLRDDRGQLLKPPGYRAAMLREQRMEYAETKRILYVACTRAADLLVLSAREGFLRRAADTGFAANWLTEVMEAFALSYDEHFGGRRVARKPKFGVTCYRHEAGFIEVPPVFGQATPATDDQRLDHMPPMSLVPDREEDILRDGLSEDTPGQQIGIFMHDILALWQAWAKKSDAELAAYVRLKARQRKMTDSVAVENAISCLLALRGKEEATAISAAVETHTELPVAWREGHRVIHRRIDLAYKTAAGDWHIVDWKTEAVTAENLIEVKSQYVGILAEYAKAFHALAGQWPTVSLCFLFPHVRFLAISSSDLDRVSSLRDSLNP